MSNFGLHLRELMYEQQITVRVLAAKMDVPESTISRWRASTKGPRIGDVVKLADALGRSPSELLPPKTKES